MKFLHLVSANLLRNKRRSVLTFLAVALSIFIFATLMSLPGLVNQALRERSGSRRLIVQAKAGFFYPLPEAYATRIRALPHVAIAAGSNIFLGYYRQPDQQVASIAVDHDSVTELFPEFDISNAQAKEFQRDRTAAFVGGALAKTFRWRVGDRLTLRGTSYPVDAELRVVGTLEELGFRDNVVFRRDYLEELTGRPATVNLFWVKVDSVESMPSVIEAIDETFANSAAETETESELGFAQSQMSAFRILFDGVQVLAAIVMFSIGLVAANTAAMSARERRSEIALMRALGYSRSMVVGTFLAEGLAIAIAAGLLGCAAAYGILRLIPYASATLGPIAMNLELPWRVVVMSMAVAATIGVLASAVPAFNAVRRNIVDSLRAVG